MTNYLVATIKSWNVEAFERNVAALPGCWFLVTRKADLLPAAEALQPRYVFFPHWSWIVPNAVLENHECVCFHMADVPYGRGGSPLQNLIVRGHKTTQLSALRMVEELDAGPVYGKLPLSLVGRAQDIFERCADRVYELVQDIVNNEPEPQAQTGEATVFSRRTPEQSVLPESGSLADLYDHIRMLDAEGYPQAYVSHGQWRLELSDAELEDDEVRGSYRIRRHSEVDQ